ncbi:MAG TPA: hypothetical protein VM368_07790, partial [Flavisolibacter sp.]|nr:hypothetical protein [Flavisolibacter sp.]
GYYFISNSIKQLPVPEASNRVTETNLPVTVSENNALKETPAQQQSAEKIFNSKESNIQNKLVAIRGFKQGTEDNIEAKVIIKPELSVVDDNTPAIINEVSTSETASINHKAENEVDTDDHVDNKSTIETAPYSVESVTNYKPIKIASSRLKWQFAFSPTISYRKLGENTSYMRDISMQNAPSTFAPLYNVNNAVMHKPDIGFEIGVATKYSITDNVRVTGGLQFNINRYDIKAFSAPYSVATIRLNNGSRMDSVRAFSNYSNTNGYSSDWLQNLYFQISAPIGVELKLRGDDKMSFGIATTIQPTYLIGERAYIITSDYKSYAQVPWLTRRWNVNSNFQTFVSYSAGKTKWQVGPQVRYQLLSSFISKYPVKENLFDFGLRVGISLDNK